MTQEFNPNEINLILGLGNPGKDYQNTYHNAGSLFVEYVKKNRKDLSKKIDLVISTEFMNNSGRFARKEISYRGIKTNSVVVAHDDSDLIIGSFKIDFDRGSAGHNGVASVISNLKTRKFYRIRIGIRPEEKTGKREKAEKFVLKKINARNKKVLEGVFENICDKIAKRD